MTLRELTRRDALAASAGVVICLVASACSNDERTDPTSHDGDSASGSGDTTTSIRTAEVADEDFVDLSADAVVDISVIDNMFEPRWVIVAAGTKVRWTNNGRNHHDIVAVPEDRFVGISHEDFPNGSVHTVTFDDPGEFPYYCTLHGTPRNGQNGVIRVSP